MEQKTIMENYSVEYYNIPKTKLPNPTIESVIELLKERIDKDPVATFITIFDHFVHTQKGGGEINKEIKDAKNIVFCFGRAIPNPLVVGLRPRSFGIVDLGEKIQINFMTAPKADTNKKMQSWVTSLV